MKELLRRSYIADEAFKVILGVALIFFCAQTRIPIKPVPITMSTVGIMILSLCYQKREARGAVIAYVVLGLMGMPIFSGFKGGISVILGTSGGYFFGMILCVYVVTSLRERFGDKSLLKLAIYSVVGSICIYTFGILQLASFVGLEKSLEFGLYPFILPGLVKAMMVASSVKLLRKN